MINRHKTMKHTFEDKDWVFMILTSFFGSLVIRSGLHSDRKQRRASHLSKAFRKKGDTA